MISTVMHAARNQRLNAGFRIGDELVGRVSRFAGVLAAVGVIAILLTMVLNVGMRVTGRGSLAGSYELIETGVVVVTFLGLPLAERTRANVRIDLVTTKMSDAWAGRSRFLASLLALTVTLLLAVASWQVLVHSINTYEVRQGIVAFPLWPARLAVAVGFTILFFEFCCTLIRTAFQSVGDQYGAESEI